MSLDWTSYAAQAQAIWATPNAPYALAMLAVAGVLCVFVGRKPSSQRGPISQKNNKQPRGTPWWSRLWTRIRPGPHDAMRLPGLVIDRHSRPHAAWLGPTGYGKSSAVAVSRIDGVRPTLIICPDLSDPLRDAVARVGGVIWNASGDGPQGLVVLDFLKGTPRDVARRLTSAFRSGGTGAWKRTARRAVDQVVAAMDYDGEPRSLAGIAERLTRVGGNEMRQLAIAAWVERFSDLAEDFDEAIGAGGQDLAQLLNQGRTVLLEIDSFTQQGMLEDLVSLGLVEAKRCAELVTGGFRLVVEEAGQLEERIDLVLPFLRAGRRRRVPVDLLTQFGGDLSRAMSQNVATWVLFAQEDDTALKAAASRTGLTADDFDPDTLGPYTAWVKHGRLLKKVRFRKPPAAVSAADTADIKYDSDDGYDSAGTVQRRGRIQVIERKRGVLPALPPPSRMSEKLMAGLVRDGTCLRWTGKHDRKGYGLVWIEKTAERDGYWDYVHILRYEQAYGPLQRTPMGNRAVTIDHQCRVKDCAEVCHLEPVTRSENTKRRWRVRGS